MSSRLLRSRSQHPLACPSTSLRTRTHAHTIRSSQASIQPFLYRRTVLRHPSPLQATLIEAPQILPLLKSLHPHSSPFLGALWLLSTGPASLPYLRNPHPRSLLLTRTSPPPKVPPSRPLPFPGTPLSSTSIPKLVSPPPTQRSATQATPRFQGLGFGVSYLNGWRDRVALVTTLLAPLRVTELRGEGVPRWR